MNGFVWANEILLFHELHNNILNFRPYFRLQLLSICDNFLEQSQHTQRCYQKTWSSRNFLGNFISPIFLDGNFIYTQTYIKNIIHYVFNTCTSGIYEINHKSKVIYEINPKILTKI